MSFPTTFPSLARSPRLAVGLLMVSLFGCDGDDTPSAPSTVTAPAWEVTFQSEAPQNPPNDSLFFELVNAEAIARGMVDVAIQVRNPRRRLVQAEGSVTYGPTTEGAAQPVSFRGFFEGGFFERAGRRVLYDVDDLSLFQQVAYDIAIDGPSDGVEGSGTLVTLRFDLRRSGEARIDEALLAVAKTARGEDYGYPTFNENVFGGILRVRQR